MPRSTSDTPPLTKIDLARLVVAEVCRIFRFWRKNSTNPKQQDAILTTLFICDAYIHILRDFKRYKHAMNTTYPTIKGGYYKFDYADYLTMEALRVFEPEVYAYIQSEWCRQPWYLHCEEEWASFRTGLREKICEEMSEERRKTIEPLILHKTFPQKRENDGAPASRTRIAYPVGASTYFNGLNLRSPLDLNPDWPLE